jgi:hypothetical protein
MFEVKRHKPAAVPRQANILSMFSRAPKTETQAPLSTEDEKRLTAAHECNARCAEQQRIKLALKTVLPRLSIHGSVRPKSALGRRLLGAKVKTRNGTNFVLSLSAVSCLSQEWILQILSYWVLSHRCQETGMALQSCEACQVQLLFLMQLQANVKRGKYHKLEPELKYQFFETHRLLKNKSIRETMAWFNEHLPLVYCTGQPYTISSRSGGQVHLSD